MHALAHWSMPSALNVNEMCTSMVDAFSIVHFVNHFYAKTINSNIKPSAKSSNKRITNVNRVIKWANIHVYAAKHAIAMIMFAAKDSSMKRMHRFHVPSVITRHRKRKTSACRHVHINLVVKVPMTMMITMMTINGNSIKTESFRWICVKMRF